MNYPRRHVRRNESSDSLASADLGGPPRRGTSSDLSLYGESSRDLLEFSRYVDEKETAPEKDGYLQTPRKSKSSRPKQSIANSAIGSNSFPNLLSSTHGSSHVLGSPTWPASMDREIEPLKTPRSIEMTNTRPGCGDVFVPPFSDEKCSPRCISHRSHCNESSDCCSASHKSWLENNGKKDPPAITHELPARASSESVARRRTLETAPSRGSVRGTKSFDDSYSSSSNSASPRHRSTHFLQWDRPMVQIVPGYSLPLAGLQESIAAYQRQAVEETVCQACQTELFCIDSASMVLCPVCRSFSPICTNDAAAAGSSGSGESSEQLGLGLTIELLAEELGGL